MSDTDPQTPVEWVVDEAEAGQRFDAALAARFPQHSRGYLQRVIDAAGARVDGHQRKPSYRLRKGERVSVVPLAPPREGHPSEDIPLDILYEDDWLVAVNKPPGMVVHPGKGHWSGTLTSALQHHFDQLSTLGGPTRPGIVHRLDRDTSGVILVAKTDPAHAVLAERFAERTVEKEYWAIVVGRMDRDADVIELPIGPHPYQREKMAIRRDHPDAREARTFYQVVERFPGFALVKAFPKTGRTHQIRVHLAAVGCPILCDRLYGGRARITLGELTGDPDAEEVVLERQALHAARIKLRHPGGDESLEVSAGLPEDMERVLTILRGLR